MKRLSKDEITTELAIVPAAEELQATAAELVAATLKKHQHLLKPKRALASVPADWLTNTTPRWCGVPQAPCSPQHGKS